MRYASQIVQAASPFRILVQGHRAINAALLLCLSALITGCGFSSNSIAIVGPPQPTLASISVGPADFTLHVGSTRQFIATGTYSDGSQQDITATVTWSSSAATVASVNNTAGSNGIVTGVGSGTTTITAASGTVSGSAILKVTSVTLVSIGVTPAGPTIAKGTTLQFTATGVYSDNSTQDLTNLVTWHAVNPAVATITTALGSGGLATGVAPGMTQITATLDGVVGSTNLKVTAAVLVSIAVTPPNASIAKGTTQQYTATGTYSDNTTQDLTTTVTWGPTASSVATASNAAGSIGKVTALGTGTVTITATLGGVTGSTMLTVTPAALVSIAVTPANPSIANGSSQQFTATGTYTDATTQDLTTAVTWAPATGTVATLSNTAGSQGLAVALSPGTVTVSATLGNVVGTTGLTVTAVTLVSIAITPTTATIRSGPTHAQQYIAIGHYSDLSTQDITAQVTWLSSNTTTATISNAGGSQGLATGLAQGTTTITAVSGTITSNPATLTVAAFAYAVNYLSNNVSQYIIGLDGTLTAIGAGAVAASANPYSLAEDPSGQYLYVANYNASNTISQYAIGADGTLTAIGTGLVTTTGLGPNGITVSPVGPYVYTANFNTGDVSQYTIAAGGSLTFDAVVGAGSGAASIALNSSATFAYVANYLAGTVSMFSVAADGTLAPLGTVAAGTNPDWILIDPLDRFVYVANSGDNTVSQYTVGAGGLLTLAATVGTGSLPWSITIDSAGHNAYVPDRNDSTVWHYTIDPTTGALTWANTLTLPPNSGPTDVAIDPSGLFAYITDRGPAGTPQTTISQCSVAADGTLTLLTPPTAPAGTSPAAILTTR